MTLPDLIKKWEEIAIDFKYVAARFLEQGDAHEFHHRKVKQEIAEQILEDLKKLEMEK